MLHLKSVQHPDDAIPNCATLVPIGIYALGIGWHSGEYCTVWRSGQIRICICADFPLPPHCQTTAVYPAHCDKSSDYHQPLYRYRTLGIALSYLSETRQKH